MSLEEKRNGMAPIPENLPSVVNPLQMLSMRRLESFGWELQFVRRRNMPEPIPVVMEPGSGKTGVLDADGNLVTQHQLHIRP